MSTPPSGQLPDAELLGIEQPTETERRERRFRIAGDPVEAMKVVLAQLPDDEI